MNYQFKSCVLDLAKETDHEILDIAKKRGIIYPSQHLAIFKTVYAKIEEANLNGVRLSKESVDKSIQTLVGKQVNLEHLRYGFICGVILDAWLNKDNEIEVAFSFFKDIYEEEYQRALAKLIEGQLSVSFELNCSLDKQEMLSDGTIRLHEITFGGMGLLIDSKPAYPKAQVFEMASRILNRVKMSNDLVMASQVQEGCINALKQAGVYCTDNMKLHYHFAAIDDMGNGVTLTITTDPSYDGDANHVHKIENWQVMEASGHIHHLPASMIKETPKISQIQAKKIRKKTRITKDMYYACPYCENEIKPEEMYKNPLTNDMYHMPCMNEGPVEYPMEGEKIMELTEDQKKIVAQFKEEYGDEVTEYKDEDFLDEAKVVELKAAKWTRKYINDLPNSSFAVIEPAFLDGKTDNKNARHLPYKDANGKIDLPHYRNALARANQIIPVTDSISTEELRSKAMTVLEKHKNELKTAEELAEEERLRVEAETKARADADEKVKADAKQAEEVATKAAEDAKQAQEAADKKAQEDEAALPPEVTTRMKELMKQGVPAAEAMKQAWDEYNKKKAEVAEVVSIKAENEQLKTKVTDLENQLKVKDESIAKIRQDAEALGKIKAELSTNPFVKEFKDEDYLNPEKVKNAKLQYENEQLKAKQSSVVVAAENTDLVTGHKSDSKDGQETNPRLVIAKLGKRD